MIYDFDVRAFGAVGDGETLDTAALQAAVNAAAVHGGRVTVPAGTYRTGTVELKSRVTLDLRQGAVLLGSADIADYTTHTWGHHQDITPWHLIYAEDAEDIVITGEGAIDGNGPAFWEPERAHAYAFWHEKTHRPSGMVELTRCRNVRVETVTLRNSAGWTLHLHDCDHSQVRGLNIRGTQFGPNTDGIDASGCHYLTISDCHIVCGDDAIALKTTECTRSCEYVTITNCILDTNCVAVRIGFESRQPFRYITVSNCVVPRCSRVIDLRSTEGGDIEHVIISGITGTTNCGWPVNRPVEISLHRVDNQYARGLPPEHPFYGQPKPIAKAGVVRDITIRDLDVVTDGRITIVADADAEMRDIRLENIRLRYVLLDDPAGFAARGGTGFMPGDHADARGARAAVVAKHVSNLHIANLDVRWPTYPVPDGWRLFESENRLMNPAYAGDAVDARSGAVAPVFHAVWGKDLTGGRIDLTGLSASAGGAPAALENSTATIVR